MPEEFVLTHGSGVFGTMRSSWQTPVVGPSCAKSVAVTQILLGEWVGGGGDTIGGAGGSANREPGSYRLLRFVGLMAVEGFGFSASGCAGSAGV